MMCSEASKASVLDASGPRSGFRTGVFHTFALIMIQRMMDPAPQLHSLNFSIITFGMVQAWVGQKLINVTFYAFFDFDVRFYKYLRR